MILAGMFLLFTLLVSGCASGPHYGSGKKRKECDCPKWNAVPKAPTKDVRVSIDGLRPVPVAHHLHVTRN
jgi:hypothetical protein